MEYTFSEGKVHEQLYHGTLNPPNADGLITVDYDPVGTATAVDIGSGAEFEYEPVPGSQYFWVEGQEKTQTEVRYYKKSSFNLFGGGTWFDDALVGDESYKWHPSSPTRAAPRIRGHHHRYYTTDVNYRVEYKTRSVRRRSGRDN
jgi:hypothetical protein